MKVILDTNLLVAAFWNRRSASAGILDDCLEGRLSLVYTAAIKREVARILRHAQASQAYRAKIDRLLDSSLEVEPATATVTTEDPEDQKFLECAVASEADFLITNDEHLLRLRGVDRTAIVTPTQFRRLTR